MTNPSIINCPYKSSFHPHISREPHVIKRHIVVYYPRRVRFKDEGEGDRTGGRPTNICGTIATIFSMEKSKGWGKL